MSKTISVRDYDHRLHEFVLRGSLLEWYFTTAGADLSVATPDMIFDTSALRSGLEHLDGLAGGRVGPIGMYRLRRDGPYFGLAHPRYPERTFWFTPEAREPLVWLLASRARKVVSV